MLSDKLAKLVESHGLKLEYFGIQRDYYDQNKKFYYACVTGFHMPFCGNSPERLYEIVREILG